MTLVLRYAVRSDVGLLREGNEDSAYAGPRLLAVADGMGGHAAGEVASAVAISVLSALAEDLPASELVDALADAVARANQQLHDLVAANPSIGGMGTTLTAMLWSGTRVALCHIGDSRAYLLSGGELQQITHDHTLVQSLVDDGRISPDEAATHGSGRHAVHSDTTAGRTVLTQTAPQAAIVIAHDDPVPRAAGGPPLDDDEPEAPGRRRLPIVKSLVALLLILIIGAGYAGWR